MAKKGLIVSADDQIRFESIQPYLQGEISQVNPGETISLDGHSFRVVHPEKVQLAGQTVEISFDLEGKMKIWLAGMELKWERVRNQQRIRARGVA